MDSKIKVKNGKNEKKIKKLTREEKLASALKRNIKLRKKYR